MAVLALAHRGTVVGDEDDQRVVFHAERADIVHEMTEPFVHHRHLFGVQGADVFQFAVGVQAVDMALDGQEHVLAFVVGVIGALQIRIVHGGSIPRFVRIKAVDPHEEGLVAVDALQVPYGFLHDLGGVLIAVGFPVLALLEMAFNLVHERAHDVFPKDLVGFFHYMIFIVVLGLEAAAEFVLCVILVIGLMPVQEEHLVEAPRVPELGQSERPGVVDQVAVDGLPPAQIRNGGVADVELRPALHRQGVAPCEHGPAAGHGGQAFRIGVFEDHAFGGEAVDVRGLDPRIAVAAQIVELERIQHHDDDILLFAHDNTFCFFRVESKGAGDHFAISPLMTSALRTDSSSTNARQSLLSR